VFDGLSSHAHGLGHVVEPGLHSVEHVLILPALDADTGGERAAALYTIVQTAKLNGVNSQAYLRDTLTRIAQGHLINWIDDRYRPISGQRPPDGSS
jgi:hypothetical protein